MENVGIWRSKLIIFKKWEEVIEEDFSRGNDTCVRAWRIPRNLLNGKYEWGVMHFVLKEKQEQRLENGKNITCLTENTAFVLVLPKSILYCRLIYRTLTTPLQ